MRRQIIAGNWKMNMDLESGPVLAEAIVTGVQSMSMPEHLDVVLCPPFILLPVIGRQLGFRVALGAQTMHKPSGAVTARDSGAELLGALSQVLLGHSSAGSTLGGVGCFGLRDLLPPERCCRCRA